MPTAVLAWHTPPDSPAARDAVGRAAAALAAGATVAFPTDTVYMLAAAARDAAACARLPGELVLAVHGAGDAQTRLPELSPTAGRLARRCWPGPVTLTFPGGGTADLPGQVAERVAPGGRLHLRSPGHAAIHLVLRAVGAPLALAETTAATVAGVLDGLPAEAAPALVIDDGETPYGRPATVVAVNGDSWRVVREGALTAGEVRRATACLVVFVCTGNTCRSPLAEALLCRKLADRLGCPPEDLPDRGFVVQSAGLAAMMGGEAAAEAVRAAGAYGAPLDGHVSQPLTAALAARADHLVVMTRSHLQAVRAGFRRLAAEPRLLDPAGADLADPIGGSPEVYRECAARVWGHLDGLVEELLAAGRAATSPAAPPTQSEHTAP